MQCFRLVKVGMVRVGPVRPDLNSGALLIVLDRFQDHQENKLSSEGMTMGSITAPHRRAVSGLALRPLSLYASQEIFTRAALGVVHSPFGGKRMIQPPSVEGGWIRWVAPDHLV